MRVDPGKPSHIVDTEGAIGLHEPGINTRTLERHHEVTKHAGRDSQGVQLQEGHCQGTEALQWPPPAGTEAYEQAEGENYRPGDEHVRGSEGQRQVAPEEPNGIDKSERRNDGPEALRERQTPVLGRWRANQRAVLVSGLWCGDHYCLFIAVRRGGW